MKIILRIINTPPTLIAERKWGIYQVTAYYSDGHINSKSYECFTPVEATRKYLMEFGSVMGKVKAIFQNPIDKSKENGIIDILRKRGLIKMLFRCEVFNKRMGWDEYLVSAKSKEEALKKCRKRLDEETDDSENWEIVYIETE